MTVAQEQRSLELDIPVAAVHAAEFVRSPADTSRHRLTAFCVHWNHKFDSWVVVTTNGRALAAISIDGEKPDRGFEGPYLIDGRLRDCFMGEYDDAIKNLRLIRDSDRDPARIEVEMLSGFLQTVLSNPNDGLVYPDYMSVFPSFAWHEDSESSEGREALLSLNLMEDIVQALRVLGWGALIRTDARHEKPVVFKAVWRGDEEPPQGVSGAVFVLMPCRSL